MNAARFVTTIGLEVHCQLGTPRKLFADVPAAFGGAPNSRVGPVDLGLPGVLPMLDELALELAIRAGIALEAEIAATTHFERKQYFYPDLPKGYQISQLAQPLCRGGRVPLGDGRYCPLTRIHLEEDAGKSMHDGDVSLVDLNRAGIALIEIVSEPRLHAAEDAHLFLDNLKQILRYAGVSECDMEKGSLRCDANVSLARPDDAELGTKVEIKNLNSFKMVQRALEYEERRQAALLAAGGRVGQETRLWNEEKGETAPMRSKEQAHDYRYFPDPDLPAVEIGAATVERVRAALPELPATRRRRYADELGLGAAEIDVLLHERELGDYYEQVLAACGDAKTAYNWVATEVLRARHAQRAAPTAEPPLPAKSLGELITAVADGTINRGAGKKVFAHLVDHPGKSVVAAIAELGLAQIRDRDALRAVVAQVLEEQAAAAADYRAGRTKAWHALKGTAMRKTAGRADPALLEELLREELQ